MVMTTQTTSGYWEVASCVSHRRWTMENIIARDTTVTLATSVRQSGSRFDRVKERVTTINPDRQNNRAK